MRSFVLILMVALLPLRLWAAEGMSVRMAFDEAHAVIGAPVDSMPEDCPMKARPKAASDAGDDSAQSVSHCFACQLSAASAPVAVANLGRGPAPAGLPSWSATLYASADLPRALRPPIS